MFNKKWLTMVWTLVFTVVLAATCFAADSYQKIYDVGLGMKELAQDEASSQTFQTADGEVKVQVRKLANASSKENYHMLVWLGKNRIFDKHFPVVNGGYEFRVFKNSSDGRLFYEVSSKDRAYLYGYDAGAKKFMVYVDSQNYYNNFAARPMFAALKNGDLVLAFKSENLASPYYHRYRLQWDATTNWFGYADQGVIYENLASVAQ